MPTFPRWPNKDPDDIKDFGIHWASFLQTGETIVSSTWVITGADAALIIVPNSQTIAGAQTTLWLSGGTAGVLYLVTNHITTNSSPIARVEDQTMELLVKQR